MYVCICNAIRERDLRDAARRQDGCARTLYAHLGHVPQCGQCLDEATEVVVEARNPRVSRASAGCFAAATV